MTKFSTQGEGLISNHGTADREGSSWSRSGRRGGRRRLYRIGMVSQRNWSIGNGKCHNRRIQLQPTLDKVFAYRVSVHRFQAVGRPMNRGALLTIINALLMRTIINGLFLQ